MDTNTTLQEVQNSNFFRQADQKEADNILSHIELMAQGLDAIRSGSITFELWQHNTIMSYAADYQVTRIIKQIIRGDEAKLKAEANQKKWGHVQPVKSTTFTVGAILIDTWGCEQTNKDFYCIVARSGYTITLMPMSSETSGEIGFMTHSNLPLVIDWKEEPIRKRIKAHLDGFSLRSGGGGGWVALWDGRAEVSTHYA